MLCIWGFILFDGIGENPCAEHHESNSNLDRNCLAVPYIFSNTSPTSDAIKTLLGADVVGLIEASLATKMVAKPIYHKNRF